MKELDPRMIECPVLSGFYLVKGSHTGGVCPEYTSENGRVTLNLYGGEITYITIDGKDMGEIYPKFFEEGITDDLFDMIIDAIDND